jgi:hypothetical protein
MAKKPELPKPIVWTVYKLAAKQTRLSVVQAPTRPPRVNIDIA